MKMKDLLSEGRKIQEAFKKKSLLNESPSDAKINELKSIHAEYKKILQFAIRELNKTDENMQKIILMMNNMTPTPEEKEDFVQNKLESFWDYDKNSSASKLMKLIKKFADSTRK